MMLLLYFFNQMHICYEASPHLMGTLERHFVLWGFKLMGCHGINFIFVRLPYDD